MSTADPNHFKKGLEHTPEVGYLPDETYPNYLLGHDGGNGTVDTGLADDNYDRDYGDEYLHPFEVLVTDGKLYVAPGTYSIREFGPKGDVLEPTYPLLDGGGAIGPLGEDGLVSTSVDPDHTRVVLEVPCGGVGGVKVWTDEEYDEYIDNEEGFLVVIATLEIDTQNIVTSFTQDGVPLTTSQIEAIEITQLVHSDIFVNLEILCDSDSGDSGGSGSGGSGGSDDGDSGTSKDSAIVPVNWTKTGFTALYCVEAPDVRFEDTIVVERPKWARNWSVNTCGKFRSVLEDGSMEVVSYTTDKPVPVGFSIDERGVLYVRTSYLPFNRPNRLVVKLAGIRRGFAGVKFEQKTQAEFDANEKRLTLDL